VVVVVDRPECRLVVVVVLDGVVVVDEDDEVVVDGGSVVVVVVGSLALGTGGEVKYGPSPGRPEASRFPPRSYPPRCSRLARAASDSMGAGSLKSVGSTPFMASAM
jgi:hypothetical protein